MNAEVSEVEDQEGEVEEMDPEKALQDGTDQGKIIHSVLNLLV
jgi:hypothetical protein